MKKNDEVFLKLISGAGSRMRSSYLRSAFILLEMFPSSSLRPDCRDILPAREGIIGQKIHDIVGSVKCSAPIGLVVCGLG